MNALITGVAGFAGSHLAERLLASGHAVTGVVRPGTELANLAGFRERLELVEAPLEAGPLADALAAARCDVVFHLAAQAHVARSWKEREETFRSNVLGTIATLDAALAAPARPRVVLASSAEVYGREGTLFSEESPSHPDTPYALSKLMAEEAALSYHRWDGLPVVVARAFNHTGPRQEPTFVCAEFARQLAEIAHGSRPPRLVVGNLEARRDFSDVRDVVRGYELLAERGAPGRVYNLCSGRAVSVRSILDRLRELVGREVAVEIDPAKLRKLDVPELVGDPRRAREELGYAPEIPLEDTLRELLAYWTGRSARHAG